MSERFKTVEIDGASYTIKKLDAVTTWKVAKLILSKLLPGVDLSQGLAINLEEFDLNSISKVLDGFSDEDMDKLFGLALKNCSKKLAVGETPVMNQNGSFAIPEVEEDPILLIQLVCEAIKFGISDFFDESRLGSFIGLVTPLFQPEQPM